MTGLPRTMSRPRLAGASEPALKRYRAKRDFAATPEPNGEAEAQRDPAGAFVVQKHWASRLHYDFRLEMDGTLKSWAVPKGPSLDPHDKRMAVQVEDHPLAYADFEGTIPAGQYGAGKVIVWDMGRWVPLVDPVKGYRDGHLKFVLHGHKLAGHWALVRINGKGEKQQPWLLIKERDEFAQPSTAYSVVDEMPDSVKVLPSPTLPAAKAAPSAKKIPPRDTPKVALPARLAPELATLVDRPPEPHADWLCEIKFDGYRLLARVDGRSIRLFTRNGNDWTVKLDSVRAALAELKLPSGWYDGEIVVMNDAGIPDFGALQQALDATTDTGVIVYCLFDLPFFDGHDLRQSPLESRRELLRGVLARSPSERIRFSEGFDASPQSVLSSACRLGLEGIIAKRRDSSYVSRRSTDWVKLKCGRRQEFVIGGYTDPQGARTGIGALLLGVHDERGALQYAGNVGSGFSERSLAALTERLQALRATRSPFDPAAKIPGRPHWVRPTLVAEVSFGEWTRSHRIRHAVFRGLREDKRAADIVREQPVHSAPTAARTSAAKAPTTLADRVRVTHPERIVDAASGATKIELVRYYGLVGTLMMVHLKGRPVSLVRAPDGVAGELFFQKHAETQRLPGVRQLDPALYPGHPPLLEVAGVQGLLSAAQWNVLEFHTSNMGGRSFEHPDRIVFDLDPGEGVAWARVQEGAQLTHAFLDQLGLPAYLKTSGGKGLHVVVPLRKVHDWDTVKGFAQAVVRHLARTLPDRFVAKSGPRNRKGRIFIDYLRNGLGATTVCAWSARARPGLGVSVPLDWKELASLTASDQWTIRNVHERLDVGNAPWDGYAKAARTLTAAMKRLGWQAGAAR